MTHNAESRAKAAQGFHISRAARTAKRVAELDAEVMRLEQDLGRAYRALHGFYNAHTGKITADPHMEAYHLPTIGAAARFVYEQSLEGADYFVGKKIEVLHAALKAGDSE